MAYRHKLQVGTRMYWDGEPHTVVALRGGLIELRSQRHQVTMVDAAALTSAPDFKVLDVDLAAADIVTFPDAASPASVEKAKKRLEDLNEALTGYRSGHLEFARKDEPREGYDPNTTTLTDRITKPASLSAKSTTIRNGVPPVSTPN